MNKCRVFDKKENKMLEPFSFLINHLGWVITPELLGKSSYEDFNGIGYTDRFVVSWYSQYNDINNNEIYEGDIIRLAPPEDVWVGVVTIVDGCFVLKYKNGEQDFLYEIASKNRVQGEVIDNIYNKKED